MPIYLIHGFKWVRRSIRIHIILQDVNEASADYLMQETTPIAMRASLTKLYPDIMKHLPDLQFIEQHDPEADGPDLAAQPYAFVADKVIESNLSISVEDAQVKNPISTETWEAMAELKDKLEGTELGWFAVYNGNVGRAVLPDENEESDNDAEVCKILLETLPLRC